MLHTTANAQPDMHAQNTANPCLSAKDKAILEAAYNANPKPDKPARLDIVKRVSLNEKEVQVRRTRFHRSWRVSFHAFKPNTSGPRYTNTHESNKLLC